MCFPAEQLLSSNMRPKSGETHLGKEDSLDLKKSNCHIFKNERTWILPLVYLIGLHHICPHVPSAVTCVFVPSCSQYTPEE